MHGSGMILRIYSVATCLFILSFPFRPRKGPMDDPWGQFSPVICLKEMLESSTLNPLSFSNSY